jgi:hypothetical protein
MVYEGNVPPFQCKKSFDRSSSMGEVDGLSLTDVMFQRSHRDSIEVRPRFSILRT